MKKHLVRWLSLLLIVVAVIGITLVSAKEPTPKAAGLALEDMPMVLPANATDVEKTAAKELQHYLREMTGTNSSIITESVPVENAIYIGATKFAEENNVTYTNKNNQNEGWAIKAIGNNLVITGGVQRGTLYGVYHLLEDVFGVHWWNMWEEYVPELDSAVVPYDFDLSGEPVFGERSIYSNESLSTLYYVRNRLNGWTSNAPQAYGGENNFGRPYHVHTFDRYFPPFYRAPTSASAARWTDTLNPEGISYFNEHPDWYAWSDARESRISFGQMCMSNEELLDEFIIRVLKAIKLSYEDADKAGIDRPKYIDISPNDTGGHCECDACTESMAVSGPSGHLLKFINQIADAVYEVYPEIKVETLAYSAYFELPLDGTKPRDNMVIRLASNDRSIPANMTDPINKNPKKRLEVWGDYLKPGQLIYWDYAVNYSENGVMPNMFNYEYDWRYLYENNGYGVFLELQEINESDFWDMKHWLLTKLMEDPYQDQFELANTFANLYYGSDAAEEIMEWLLLIDKLVEPFNETTQIRYSGDFIDNPWLSVQNVKYGHELFEKAIAETEANPDLTAEEKELFINRINFARTGLDRQILANYTRYVNEMAETGDLFDISKRETGERMVASMQWVMDMELENDYTGDQNPVKRGNLGGSTVLTTYAQYVGMQDPNTGEYLDRPALPEQIFEDHPGIDARHIYDYTDSTFWDASYHFGYNYVGSYFGKASYEGGSAVVWDIRTLASNNEDGELTAHQKHYYTFSETKTLPGLEKMFLNKPIIADGEWHLYRMEDRIVRKEGSSMFSVFGSTMRFELDELEHLTNDPVDVYLNMKIEGDPTGEDPNNYAKIYIDRVIFVEDCTGHDINYTSSIPATCAKGQILVGTCPICGKEARKEVAGTKLNHTLTGDYVYDAATNTYTANCAVCGEVEYTNLKGKLPDDVMASLMAEGTELDRVYDYGVHDFTLESKPGSAEIIEDSDSDLGEAAYWDIAKVNAQSYFHITDTQGIRFSRNNAPYPTTAKDIITDGEYHVYKMEDVDLFAGDDPRLIIWDWTLQLKTDSLRHLEGKKVDLYFSFKVEGELKYDDPNNMPKYYVDRMIIAENCPEHSTDNMVYDAAQKAYVGTCDNCGKTIKKEVLAELPQEVLDAIAKADSSLTHVHDYDIDDFFYAHSEFPPFRQEVADNTSAVGKALYYNTNHTSASTRNNYFAFSGSKEFTLKQVMWESTPTPMTGISGKELNANSGDGQYHLYKISGILLPSHVRYIFGFDYYIQYTFQDIKAALTDLPLDVYISMKVEGDVTCADSKNLPEYWVDRIIVVDTCANHVEKKDLEKISDATCYQGEIWRGQCGLCGKIADMEMEETKLDHKYSDYEYDTATGNQISRCQNPGCDEFKVIVSEGDLPQTIKDDLAANNVGLDHVYDYTVDSFRMDPPPFYKQADADSLVGYAAVGDAWKYSAFNPSNLIMKSHETFPVKLYSGSSTMYDFTIGTLTYDMLNGTEGKGYQVYKFEDVTIPDVDFRYMHIFNYEIQCTELAADAAKLKGKTVDFYVSLKIEGDLDNDRSSKPGLVFYLDRIVMVDSCDNYEMEYKAPANASCKDGSVTLTATCPVCGKQKTKEGPAGGHEFGWYYRVKGTQYEYRAECIYGCGTEDFRYDPRLTLKEKLPAELPDSVKNHVIVSYSCDEFILSGEELYGYRWDHDLNRPVAVREYDTTKSADSQYGLNTSGGIVMAMHQLGRPAEGVGTFKGTEIAANAGDGKYHLYSLKGVVPIVEDNYRYMYMFSDWVLQCWMFDDDLITDYRGVPLDIYMYMRVDGDPSCAGEEKPIYYIDQIIVATSCQVDETWTVTKEATCTEMGEATGDCAICGLKGAVVGTPKLLHTVEKPLTYQDPTCKTNKWEYGLCTVCGASVTQQVPDTKLEHVFKNYVLQEDGVTEIAYCSLGCGERHIRTTTPSMSNPEGNVPEFVQPFLPVLGGAAGGSSFGFSDIKESDWYFESVKEAWSNKLINGVTATEFRPNETLTVAQAVKLASAYHEMNYTGDVTLENGSGNWYSSYVDYAVENGIIDRGYASKSTAEMNKAIDRSEFVSIFVKAMDEGSLVGYNDVADNAIPDVKTDDENADAIYKFYRAGILTGSDGKGTFNPTSSIKRSEVAAILSRMYNENVRQAITLK